MLLTKFKSFVRNKTSKLLSKATMQANKKGKLQNSLKVQAKSYKKIKVNKSDGSYNQQTRLFKLC